MKKNGFLQLLTAALLAFCLLSTSALGANQTTELAVDVTLDPDGSAYVVQTWRGTFDEGTECYFPVTNLNGITLEGLMVSDGKGTYTTKETWNPSASFAEKARTCGLNPVDGGYEVCWGISDYGENQYAIEYRLTGLAASYSDGDGFLFQFVPDGMNTGPTDVTVRIRTRSSGALTAENAAVWAFGFTGQVGFAEDGVLAYTEQPITKDNSVILMLQLNKGILTPSRTVDGSFADVKTRALEKSDYGDGSGGDNWLFDLLLFLGLSAVALAVVLGVGGREKRQQKKLYKNADYWREAPIGGNLEASFVLARRYQLSNDDGDIIAATLVRLLTEGCLEPETPGIAAGKSVSLRLVIPPKGASPTACMLYMLLERAAGGDGVLQERELERYCSTNAQSILSIVTEANRDGGGTLSALGCGGVPRRGAPLSALGDRGRNLLLQLMGYKKFLLDFSLISERGVGEALIWQDCLTYAALLGIAPRVMEQLRHHYPNIEVALPGAEAVYFMAYRYHNVTYGAAKRTQDAAQRASGGGGSSSLGGGGGFSGGGSGGGTR